MATCFDAAKYILEVKNELPVVKLQKLLYYAQAWSLVWDEAPLFKENIEAWINGPVIPVLYEFHKGKYSIQSADLPDASSDNLTSNQKDTINQVLNYYGNKSPQWLSDLTHLEDPWKNARKGIPPNERGNSLISLADMSEYYSSLPPEDNVDV